jgi:hypothetical protein
MGFFGTRVRRYPLPLLHPMKKSLLVCAGLVLGSTAALRADPVFLDFETAGQFANNFRTMVNNGSTVLSQTSNGVANDFFTSFGGSNAALVYDANGTASGTSSFAVSKTQSLTVSLDASFTTTGNSLGIYIINKNNESQGYLAFFSVNNGTGTGSDRILYSSNPNGPSTAGASGIVVGTSGFANNADTGFSPNSGFGNISLTYSINENDNPVLTMTAGSQSSSIAFTSITTPFTDVEVGFRFSSGSGTIGIDNFSISTASIPEPSTYAALFGAAVLGLAVTRRRKAL